MIGPAAGVAELADAPDLGSGGVIPVKVRVLSPAFQVSDTMPYPNFWPHTRDGVLDADE